MGNESQRVDDRCNYLYTILRYFKLFSRDLEKSWREENGKLLILLSCFFTSESMRTFLRKLFPLHPYRANVHPSIKQTDLRFVQISQVCVPYENIPCSQDVRSAILCFSQSVCAPTSWPPATKELLFIHQTLQHCTLTRQLLLIPAQISLSWNWAPFKKFIMLKRACNAKTMPFISLGKEPARQWWIFHQWL